MLRRVAALTLFLLAAPAITAVAADGNNGTKAPAPLSDAVARAARDADASVYPWALPQTTRRPMALAALYGTYGTLQVMDVSTTRKALSSGARERNPLMNNGNLAAMVAVKAAAGASTIYFAERMWKKNRAGAVIVMAALNGVSAAIVAHNQHNARR